MPGNARRMAPAAVGSCTSAWHDAANSSQGTTGDGSQGLTGDGRPVSGAGTAVAAEMATSVS